MRPSFAVAGKSLPVLSMRCATCEEVRNSDDMGVGS